MPLPKAMKVERDDDIQIWKFPLPVEDVVDIKMPAGAELLCVQLQNGSPCLWAKVDVKSTPTARRFYVVGTGHPMPVKAKNYVGTFQLSGGQLVFHVFEG